MNTQNPDYSKYEQIDDHSTRLIIIVNYAQSRNPVNLQILADHCGKSVRFKAAHVFRCISFPRIWQAITKK